MTDRERPALAGSAARQLAAMRDATLHAPKDPPRTLLWPASMRVRVPVLIVSMMLAGGWLGGSIAIYIHLMGVDPTPATGLGLTQAAPLAFAPRWPLVAWRVMAAGFFGGVLATIGLQEFWPWPVTSFLALTLVVFMVATAYDRRIGIAVGAVTILGLFWPATLLTGMASWFALILTGIIATMIAFGDAVGGRYAAEAKVEEQLELRRRDRARQAVLEERARIARELHDVVAHHMSVIAMQAEAAPYKIPELPEPAKETFGVVRDAARDALAETRRVVGLLRSADEDAERRPQPGLALLEELIAGARQTGLTIDLEIVGVPRPVRAGIDLSAYRIVQESLSNAARYAPGARVRVAIHYGHHGADRLEVAVTDDGPHGTPEESGGGHGLVGMRERVTMLGGNLSVGPRAAGGWAVRAELPYGEDDPRSDGKDPGDEGDRAAVRPG